MSAFIVTTGRRLRMAISTTPCAFSARGVSARGDIEAFSPTGRDYLCLAIELSRKRDFIESVK